MTTRADHVTKSRLGLAGRGLKAVGHCITEQGGRDQAGGRVIFPDGVWADLLQLAKPGIGSEARLAALQLIPRQPGGITKLESIRQKIAHSIPLHMDCCPFQKQIMMQSALISGHRVD
jgi:hypothetical protein